MPCNILTESKSKYITADLSSGKGHTHFEKILL